MGTSTRISIAPLTTCCKVSQGCSKVWLTMVASVDFGDVCALSQESHWFITREHFGGSLLLIAVGRCLLVFIAVCHKEKKHISARLGAKRILVGGKCLSCNSAPPGEFSGQWGLIGTACLLCKFFEADSQVRVFHSPPGKSRFTGLLVGIRWGPVLSVRDPTGKKNPDPKKKRRKKTWLRRKQSDFSSFVSPWCTLQGPCALKRLSLAVFRPK